MKNTNKIWIYFGIAFFLVGSAFLLNSLSHPIPHYQLDLAYDGEIFEIKNITLSYESFEEHYGDHHVKMRMMNGTLIDVNSFSTQEEIIIEDPFDYSISGEKSYINKTEIIVDAPYYKDAMSIEIWNSYDSILLYIPLK